MIRRALLIELRINKCLVCYSFSSIVSYVDRALGSQYVKYRRKIVKALMPSMQP